MLVMAVSFGAHASVLNLQIDVNPAKDFYFLPHDDGSVELDSYPVFSPVTFRSGDELTVSVTFGGAAIHLFDNASVNNGLEAITLGLWPGISGLTGGYILNIDLSGVSGELLPATPFTYSVGFSGAVVWQIATNLTTSDFSFTGINYDFNFTSLNQPITIDSGIFGVYAGAVRISAVPEPDALVLFCVALASLGLTRRNVSQT